MQYTYGYDITQLPQYPQGQSVLSNIDFHNLRVVGFGVTKLVLTVGIYDGGLIILDF